MASCIRCGDGRRLNRLIVRAFDAAGIRDDWGLEFFCPQCVDRLLLRCKGHDALMTCAYDPLEERHAELVPRLICMCRFCAYAALGTMPRLRQAKLFASAMRNGLAPFFLNTLEQVAGDIQPKLGPDEAVVFGFFLHAGLQGYTPEEFMQAGAKARR